MTVTNKRHDLISIDLHDPLEEALADVGLLALEDPETDEMIWVDTSDPKWQDSYKLRSQLLEADKARLFKSASVDRIHIATDEDYTASLTSFFQERARRIRR
jgi:DNA topoisomerase IA